MQDTRMETRISKEVRFVWSVHVYNSIGFLFENLSFFLMF